jgi:hypothetical protein
MAKLYFKLLSEIKEITVISVIVIGIHHGLKKTKPPGGGLSPKKRLIVPSDTKRLEGE